MSASKVMRRVQLGWESSAGTAVPATTIWRGPAVKLSANPKKQIVAEDVGISAPGLRQVTPQIGAGYKFPAVDATFEQIGYPYEAGILKVTSPSADGVGSGKIYTYNAATGVTAAPTTRTATLEAGDNIRNENAEYAFCSEISLEGAANDTWKLGSNWGARQVSNMAGGLTAALSVPTAESMLFNSSKFFLDAAGGTIGSTQLTNTVIGCKLKIDTGLRAQHTASGQLYFSTLEFVGAKITGELTMLMNASTVTEKANWLADTVRLLQIKIEGSTFAIAGTAYSKKTFIANLAMVWTGGWDESGDDNGVGIVKATFAAGYDYTSARFAQFINVVALASLP
jgi:hypothetical protein